MTFEELMNKRGGFWDNDCAWINAGGGVFLRVAEGTPGKFALTADGKRLVSDKRGRKPAVGLQSVDE